MTQTTYDVLSRVSDEGSTKSVVYPDGSTTSTTYSASGDTDCSTVIDPANIKRLLCSDGLGRLTSVEEAGTYSTSYAYDALDALETVTQGSQTRTFVYDSLKRLTSATNPESGQTSYTYDGNGNTLTREDARSITTTYTYDALNRPTGKSYNDNPQTPYVSYFYDQAPSSWPSWSGISFGNANGRLTVACTGPTASACSSPQTAVAYSYDPMGRPHYYWQCTPVNCGNTSIWIASYLYDKAGDVYSWPHPAGFNIGQTINGARQVTQVTSTLSDSLHPPVLAQNITYTPFGALSSLQNGCVGTGCTDAQETYSYNNRLQASQIQLTTSGTDYTLAYNYSLPGGATPPGCPVQAQGSGNNGNVIGYTYSDSVNPSYSNSALFVYDSVNRLACAQATGNSTYNLAFSYTQDGSSGQYGNMTCSLISQTNGPCPQYTFNAANNQITGYRYDGAGDMISGGGHTYQYDAEARLVSVDGGTTESYVYNALGQQVRLIAPNFSYTWDHLYDPAGQWMGRWSNNAWWASGVFHLAGRLFAVYFDQTYFIHLNNLGSTVMTTTSQGTVNGDTQLYPWGQDWLGGTPEWHFAAFEYGDSATGHYPTLNRQYANGEGRWLTPDPGGEKVVHLDDPQTWNMYAYARNNPTTFTDPTGLDLWEHGCGKETTTCHNDYVGTYNEKGKFIPTTIQSDANGNFKGHTVTFDTSGIHIDSKYQGVFASGTDATVVNGSGLLTGFQGTFTTNCLGTCAAGGEPSALPGHSFSELLSHLTGPDQSLDKLSGHPGQQYRGGNVNGPDLHVSYVAGDKQQGAHFDWRYPFGSASGLAQHSHDYVLYDYRSKVLGMTADPDYTDVGP